MVTTNQFLNSLIQDKQDLKEIISLDKDIDISNLNTFSDLIPKISENLCFYTPSYFSFAYYPGETLTFPARLKINKDSISHMFFHCHNLTVLNISNWDMSNTKYMTNTFAHCYNLNSLDVSNWNMNNMISLYSTFAYCYNLKTLDVSKWKTNNVEDIRYLFDRM